MEYKILSLENLPTTRAEEIDYEKEYSLSDGLQIEPFLSYGK